MLPTSTCVRETSPCCRYHKTELIGRIRCFESVDRRGPGDSTDPPSSRAAPELEAAWPGRRVPPGGVSAPRVVPVPRRRFFFSCTRVLCDNRPQPEVLSA